MGDAVRFVDPGDFDEGPRLRWPARRGLQAVDRHVGQRRAAARAHPPHFAPYVRDVVIAGHDRDEVGMLIVPDVEACRALCARLAAAPASRRPRDSRVRRVHRTVFESFAEACDRQRPRSPRALMLEEPPSLDARGDDRQGLTQSEARSSPAAALVEELYASDAGRRELITATPNRSR